MENTNKEMNVVTEETVNSVEMNEQMDTVVKETYDLFSGSDEKHKDKHALTFLLDNMIRDFSETQYIFDFEGSDNEGLARFYKGFGGKEIFYPEIKCNNLKGIFKFASKIMGKT